MYRLVQFYQAFKSELTAIHPVPKFLCVKLVVFFTFWQSVVVALCVHMGWVTESTEKMYKTDEVADGIQNFAISVEMLIAAVAHFYIFPWRDFRNLDTIDERGTQPFLSAFLQSSVPVD